MGTAMRFLLRLAGGLCICIGLALVLPSLSEVLSDPYDIDFPGGAYSIVALILVAGSAPFVFGVYLIRKARRGRQPTLAPQASAPAIVEVHLPEPPIAAPQTEAARVAAAPLAAASGPRRPWLATAGLGLVAIGALVEALLVAFTVRTVRTTGDAFAVAVFIVLGGIPLALGLWLAHVGDPGIGRRFAGDLTTNLSPLRRPRVLGSALLTTAGLAAVTVLVGVPTMLIWRRGSGIVGMMALTAFSVADPVLIAFRRSWWLDALVAASTWTLLLIVFGAVANAIEPMHEGAMIFLLPMMVFGGALGLSGIVRFVRWASAPAKSDAMLN